MPIRPENRGKYGPHWKLISYWVRWHRAGGRCERCGVANHAHGYRTARGEFIAVEGIEAEAAIADGEKIIRIVLTVAHLDHDPANHHHENLAALCQRCHLRHDNAHHAATRRARRSPLTLDLFGDDNHAAL